MAAFFDVDGTLVRSNIFTPFVMYRLSTMSLPAKLVWAPLYALMGITYLLIDRFDRTLFNRLFYANYKVGRRFVILSGLLVRPRSVCAALHSKIHQALQRHAAGPSQGKSCNLPS